MISLEMIGVKGPDGRFLCFCLNEVEARMHSMTYHNCPRWETTNPLLQSAEKLGYKLVPVLVQIEEKV